MPRPRPHDDPDEYRMTFGEHLEELRVRLILSIVGFAVAFMFCLAVVRDWVFAFLCRPLLKVMHDYELNPQLHDRTGEAFGVYLKLSAIAAAILASPWLIYQIWKFISAGLYASERRVVTKHLPLFVVLLFSGVAFSFYVVVPLTLQFLIAFSVSVPLPTENQPIQTTQPVTFLTVPTLKGDPPPPVPEGAIWFNTDQSRLKMSVTGKIRTIQYTSENLIAPFIELGDYTDMLLMMLLTFGLSFETPLVVMLLVHLNIFPLEELKKMRRVVYFVIVIIAAVITPGDAVTATIALVLPVGGLYELGLLLAREKKSQPEFIDPAP
jgi:Tat protein translocase TatC